MTKSELNSTLGNNTAAIYMWTIELPYKGCRAYGYADP